MPRDHHDRADRKSIQSQIERANLRELESPIDPLNPPPLPDPESGRRDERPRGTNVSRNELLRFIRVVERKRRGKGAPKDKSRIPSLHPENHDLIIGLLPFAIANRFNYWIAGRFLDSLQLIVLITEIIGEPASEQIRRVALSNNKKSGIDAREILEKLGTPLSEKDLPPTISGLPSGTSDKERVFARLMRKSMQLSARHEKRLAALRTLSAEHELKPKDWFKRCFESEKCSDQQAGIRMLSSYPDLVSDWIPFVIALASNSSTPPQAKTEASKCLLKEGRKWLRRQQRGNQLTNQDVSRLISIPIIQNDIIDELIIWALNPNEMVNKVALGVFRECRSLDVLRIIRQRLLTTTESDTLSERRDCLLALRTLVDQISHQLNQ